MVQERAINTFTILWHPCSITGYVLESTEKKGEIYQQMAFKIPRSNGKKNHNRSLEHLICFGFPFSPLLFFSRFLSFVFRFRSGAARLPGRANLVSDKPVTYQSPRWRTVAKDQCSYTATQPPRFSSLRTYGGSFKSWSKLTHPFFKNF